MIKRRCFLQTGALATGALVLPLPPQALASTPVLSSPKLLLHDARFPASSAFADALAASQGVPELRCLQVDGDITRLWCDTLHPLWQSAPAAISGVSGEDVLFCLQQLAVAYGLRLLEHQVLQHSGPQALVAWHIGPRQHRASILS